MRWPGWSRAIEREKLTTSLLLAVTADVEGVREDLLIPSGESAVQAWFQEMRQVA
jgi:hypothetical protein